MKMHITSYTLTIYGDNGGHFQLHRDFVGNVSNERLEKWAQEEVARVERKVYAASITNELLQHVMGWSSHGAGIPNFITVHNRFFE